ncbi:hypothetical protein ACHAXH_006085 [Discostella pseudostelligera]
MARSLIRVLFLSRASSSSFSGIGGGGVIFLLFLLLPLSSNSFSLRRTNNYISMTLSATTDAASKPYCVAQEARSLNLFSTTPLIYSIPLSKLCHPHPVYLKLDLLQMSGSFKDRGMAHLCATVNRVYNENYRKKQQQQSGGVEAPINGDDRDTMNNPPMKLISSSGGNAGLAVTTVARNIPTMDVYVIVPETTKPIVIQKLQSLGADLTVHGTNWNDADALARLRVQEAIEEFGQGHAVYVSPFDNPLLWTGHSTVVDEIVTQLLEQSPDLKMGAILASVGGGGLLSGVFEGIERNYYGSNDARANVVRGSKVFACETDGAASFAASFAASSFGKKEVSLVRLSGITSIATSLGALEVTPAVIQRAHRHQERGESSKCGEDVLSYVCSDAEAVDACLRFASDHRMLVEPACGAALAPLYTERMRTLLLNELGRNDDDGENSAIVVEVCGGSGVDLDILKEWKDKYLG